MRLADLFRRRAAKAAPGPDGVAVKLRPHNRPSAQSAGLVVPGPLWWALVLAITFYVLAHVSIMQGVWPMHGTAPGANAMLGRDLFALVAWLALLGGLKWMRYRGRWSIVVFPILIFCLGRPELFQVFTDPAHPYTRELLRSIISLRTTGLHYIPGAPPDLIDPPPGCRFHPRCPNAMRVCPAQDPIEVDVQGGAGVQRAACWLHGPESEIPPGGRDPLERKEIGVADEA